MRPRWSFECRLERRSVELEDAADEADGKHALEQQQKERHEHAGSGKCIALAGSDQIASSEQYAQARLE